MFCHKCGTAAPDGAVFCQKCGAKLIVDASATQPEPSADYARRSGVVSPELPMKKGHGKLAITFAIVALAVLAVIFTAINRESKIDYEASVRAHTPFADSRGLPHTYGEVLDKYISDAKWDIRESGDVAYVDISGEVKGTDEEISIALKASPYEQDHDLLLISTESVTVGGGKSATEDEAVRLISDIFTAYDEGADDLSGFTERLAAEEAVEQSDAGPTETPVNEDTTESDNADVYGGYEAADGDLDDFLFEIEGPYDIIEEYIQVDPYLLKLDSSYVPIYQTPDPFAEITGTITDCGTYTIVEEFHFENGFVDFWWGRLKTGAGWIRFDEAGYDNDSHGDISSSGEAAVSNASNDNSGFYSYINSEESEWPSSADSSWSTLEALGGQFSSDFGWHCNIYGETLYWNEILGNYWWTYIYTGKNSTGKITLQSNDGLTYRCTSSGGGISQYHNSIWSLTTSGFVLISLEQ